MKNTLRNKILFAPIAYISFFFQLIIVMPLGYLLIFILIALTPLVLMTGAIDELGLELKMFLGLIFMVVFGFIIWNIMYWKEFKFGSIEDSEMKMPFY